MKSGIRKFEKAVLVFLDVDKGHFSKRAMKPSLVSIGSEPNLKGSPATQFNMIHMGLMSVRNFTQEHVETEIIIGNEKAALFLGENGDLEHILVGASVTSGNAGNSFLFCAEAKKKGATTVLGGPHASLFSGNILNNREYIDFCVRGSGECAMEELVSGCHAKEIASLSFRHNKTGEIIFNNTNGSMEKWAQTEMKRRPEEVLEGVSAIVSHLGCLWRDRSGGCSFCSSEGVPFYKKSVSLVWKEIKKLQEWGAHTIYDRGDYVTFSLLKELYDARPSAIPDVKISFFMKVNDVLETGFVNLAKKIGVEKVFLGVESGSDEILRKTRKGISVNEAKQAVSILLREKMQPIVGLVIGLRGENPKTLESTVNLGRYFKEIGAEVHAGVFVPMPGSPAFELLKEKKLVNEKDDIFNLESLTQLWLENFSNINDEDIDSALLNINGDHSL